MKNKILHVLCVFFTGTVFPLLFFACDEAAPSDYYPPVIKVGFEDISDLTIANDEPNSDGGPDSTYVRLIKIVSDNSNDATGVNVFFDLVSPETGKTDTTAINNFIRLMNPILLKDSLNEDGTRWGLVWDGSRALIDRGVKQTAVMIRTIDDVASATPEKTFILHILPDRTTPTLYIVDPNHNRKKITVKDNK